MWIDSTVDGTRVLINTDTIAGISIGGYDSYRDTFAVYAVHGGDAWLPIAADLKRAEAVKIVDYIASELFVTKGRIVVDVDLLGTED